MCRHADSANASDRAHRINVAAWLRCMSEWQPVKDAEKTSRSLMDSGRITLHPSPAATLASRSVCTVCDHFRPLCAVSEDRCRVVHVSVHFTARALQAWMEWEWVFWLNNEWKSLKECAPFGVS